MVRAFVGHMGQGELHTDVDVKRFHDNRHRGGCGVASYSTPGVGVVFRWTPGLPPGAIHVEPLFGVHNRTVTPCDEGAATLARVEYE